LFGYQITAGTSVATAHIGGGAALLLERQPSLKPAEIRAILMTTAKPLGSSGQRRRSGERLSRRDVTEFKPAGKSPRRGSKAMRTSR